MASKIDNLSCAFHDICILAFLVYGRSGSGKVGYPMNAGVGKKLFEYFHLFHKLKSNQKKEGGFLKEHVEIQKKIRKNKFNLVFTKPKHDKIRIRIITKVSFCSQSSVQR